MDDGRGVRNRLLFAKRRLNDLCELKDIAGAQELEKQQPLQEFFFHLAGAVEFLAQTINDNRKLGIDQEDVTPIRVSVNLPKGDPVEPILAQLHPRTVKRPLPPDPYSPEGSHFRIILLRNRVCHHGRNAFHYRMGSSSEPPCSLSLDPRDKGDKGSSRPIIEELILFWNLVNDKCEEILSMS